MKKTFKIIICFLFIVMLSSCSCGKKSDHQLIQISGYDAYDFYTAKSNMILVLTDSTNEEYTSLMDNLTKIIKVAESNIYYVDMSYADAIQYEMLNAAFSNDGFANQIMCIQNGIIAVNQSEAIDYDQLSPIIKGKKYQALDLSAKDSEKSDFYQKAGEAYDQGLIGQSFYFYSLSIPYQDSITLLKSDKFYLLNNWLFKETKDSKYTYLNISFSQDGNILYRRYFKGSKKDFNEETLEIKSYEYYLKKKTIYVKNDSGKYEKLYTIDRLTKDELKVHTTKRTYQFDKE